MIDSVEPISQINCCTCIQMGNGKYAKFGMQDNIKEDSDGVRQAWEEVIQNNILIFLLLASFPFYMNQCNMYLQAILASHSLSFQFLGRPPSD